MGLWFLLRTVCCNCCKRSDIQHSLLCSLCSVSVLQWPQNQSIIKQIDTSLKKLRVELEDQTNSGIADDVFTEANQHKSKLYNRLRAKRCKKLKDLGIHRTSECQASQPVDGKLPRNRRFKRTSRQTDEQVTNLDSVVVNLSSAELTESEKSLLSKGLKFLPSTQKL